MDHCWVASSRVGLSFAVPTGIAAGLVSGAAAGIVGHIGGTNATRKILQLTASDMLMQYDLKPVISAREDLECQLARLQKFP